MKKLLFMVFLLIAAGMLMAAPLNQSFSSTLPTDWVTNSEGSSVWDFITSNSHCASSDHTTGTGYYAHVDFYNIDEEDNPVNLITPRLDLTSGSTTLTYWYWIGSTATAMPLEISVSSDGGATYTSVFSHDLTTTGAWTQKTLDLSTYNTNNVKVKFAAYSNYGYSTCNIGIDDVSGPNVYVAPTPPLANTLSTPANLAINVSKTPSLNWNSISGASSYKLYLGTDTDATNILNGVDQGNVLTYSASLAYNTTYYWKVVASNIYGDAPATAIWSFTTMADPTIVSFPYSENFDAVTTPALPLGWTSLDNNNDGDKWITQSSSSYSHSGSNSAQIYTDYNTANDDYLITPPISLTGNYRIKFWTRARSTTETEELSVLLSTTTPTVGALTNVLMASTPINFVTYTEYILDLSAYRGTVYIAFTRKNTPVDGYYLYLDDVSISEILPVIPEPVTLTNPSNNLTVLNNPLLTWSASLTGEAPTGYKVYLDTDGSFTTPIADVTTKYYQTSGLLNNTTYNWKVVAYNAVGDAINNPTAIFKTVTTTQLAEPFATSTLPVGWAIDASTWSSSTTSPFEGSYCYYTSTSSSATSAATARKLITPLLSINASSSLNFYARTSSTTGTQNLVIKYSTDKVTWTDLPNPVLVAQSGWTNALVDLSSLSGDYYLAIGAYSSNTYASIYIDNIVGPEITPLIPGQVTLSSPADVATSINEYPTLTWTSPTTGGIPTSYKVYLDTNANPTTLIATVNTPALSYTLTQALNYSTTYYWKVIANNNTGDGTASAVRSFTVQTDPNYGGGDASTTAGGYYFANSISTAAVSKPTYNWINPISGNHDVMTTWTSGTADVGYFTIPELGFDFTFYGNTYNTANVHVGSNGYISFGTGYTADAGSVTIPSSTDPDNMIAFCMQDMNGTADSKIYYKNLGDKFVITYWHFIDYSSTNYISAQVILYPNSNIKIQYNFEESTWPLVSGFLTDMVVGIENVDGVKGIRYRADGNGGSITTGNQNEGFAIMFGLNSATLPVELSSFTTAITANNTVAINWVTQSEHSLSGYFIHRAEVNQLASAIRISSLIPAANTSSETSYNFSDAEVIPATTYYYWLQSCESNGNSNYYGPYSVRTNDNNIVTTFPSVTMMKNAYPNPFNSKDIANISVDVKDGETASLSIYNIKGQVVKTYKNLTPGTHPLTWNGKDENNNRCAAGVYFYRLSSPTFSSVKKIMYLK